MFTRLPVDHLKITKQFPEVKDQLLQRLHDLALQYESRLGQHRDKFTSQSDVISKLAIRCQEESLTVPPSSLTETRPGELSLAARVEMCYRLSRLYSSLRLNLFTWLEN